MQPTPAQLEARANLSKSAWPRSDAAVSEYLRAQCVAVSDVYQAEAQTCEIIAGAAIDFADRIGRLAARLATAAASGDYVNGVTIAGQIFQLSRHAEHKMLIAQERIATAQSVAGGLIESIPHDRYRTGRKEVDREQGARYRARNAGASCL
jgi:hypothetical protein